MTIRIQDIEKDLWAAADELRANSKLSSQEYSVPVLGLIFLRYADYRFSQATKELEAQPAPSSRRRRRARGKTDYQARGVLYLPPEARFSTLLNLTESANVGEAINNAMRAIERENSNLKDVLPKTYLRLRNDTLFTLLKRFNAIPMTAPLPPKGTSFTNRASFSTWARLTSTPCAKVSGAAVKTLKPISCAANLTARYSWRQPVRTKMQASV